jgi:hypothetical protein
MSKEMTLSAAASGTFTAGGDLTVNHPPASLRGRLFTYHDVPSVPDRPA